MPSHIYRSNTCPGLGISHVPQQCKQHPLIGNTLQTLNKTCLQFKISSSLGPLTLIRQNLDFPLGNDGSFLPEVGPHTDPRAGDFFSGETIIPLSTLAAQMPDQHVSFWPYMQLRHFLTDSRVHPAFSRQQPQFESLCTNTEPQCHLISIIYAILSDE